MDKAQSNSNYYYKNRDKILSHAKVYYSNNRNKVLDYKKKFYFNKIYKYKAIKNIQLKGFSKRESKKELKYRIDNNILRIEIINDDGSAEALDYDEFLAKYTIKDTNIIVDFYFHSTYDVFYVVIPKFYILSK